MPKNDNYIITRKYVRKIIIDVFIILFVWIVLNDLFYSSGDYMDKIIFGGILLELILVFFLGLKSKIVFVFVMFLTILLGYEILINPQSLIISRIISWMYFSIIVGIVKKYFELSKRKS